MDAPQAVENSLSGGIRVVLIIFASAVLASCASSANVIAMDAATQLRLASQVRIFDSGEVPTSPVKQIGPVEGISCMRNYYDSGPSESVARAQLRFRAIEAGGNALVGVSCQAEGTSLSKNCWSSITCRGQAIRVDSVAPAPKVTPQVKNEESSGSGFFISRNGVVLTNSHVIQSCGAIKLKSNGVEADATVLARDESNDLAILRAQATESVPFLIFRSASPRLAEPVAALGFPLPGVLSPTVGASIGAVSALSGIRGDARFLQISAPIQPGNSGGPLIDSRGSVVGVIVGKLNALRIASATGDIPQNVNFAIGLRTAQTFLEANGIAYVIGDGAAAELSTAAQAASASVVQVICRGGA
ncbi:MAG: hypothetical protein RL500_788 [Pseudomonadota bacterium]|jgi:S1-C subfamily serine protease